MPPKPEQSEGRPRWRWYDTSSRKKDGIAVQDTSHSRPSTPSGQKRDGFDTRNALGNAGKAIDALKKVSEMSDFLGPLGTVCDALRFAVDTAESVLKNQDDIKTLLNKLGRQMKFIQEKTTSLRDAKFRPSRNAIQSLVMSLGEYDSKLNKLQEILAKLHRKDERGVKKLWHKVVSADEDRVQINICTQELDETFRLFMDSVAFFTAEQTSEVLARQALSQLQYVEGAQGNQHLRCLPGTRELLLNELTQWAVDRKAKPIYALIDRAGTGKSTVSMHMTLQFEEHRSLACCFFFSKPKGIASGEHVAATLAKEMSSRISFLRSLVINALEEHPTVSGYSVEKKIKLLVLAPLNKLREENDKALSLVREKVEMRTFSDVVDLEEWHGNVQGRTAIDRLWRTYMGTLKAVTEEREEERTKKVETAAMAYLKALEVALDALPIIVVDALDECSNDDRIQILKSFLQYLSTFPVNAAPFKLFFTCRPKKDVELLLRDPSHIQHTWVSLHSKDVSSNQQDIELYANEKLKHMLNLQQLSQFVAKANGLFIWASTAATVICKAHNPNHVFNDLIAANPQESPLDMLYDTILQDACQSVHKSELKCLLEILQLICTAKEPLTVSTIDEILGLKSETGSAVSGSFIVGLGSVMTDGSDGRPVQALHPTFIEYLLRTLSSQRFSIPRRDSFLRISERCLAILLSDQLRYDILNVIHPDITTPKNCEIKGLEQLIQLKASPGLQYAAKYMMVHVVDCIENDKVIQALQLFFKEKVLFWIELMSYLGKLPVLTASIHVLVDRLKDIENSTSDMIASHEWCNEILQMIQPFQASIMESALQVYYSALAFAPKTSKISIHYHETFTKSIPRVKRGAWALRTGTVQLPGHTNVVSCFSFSPDGHKIASGSIDGTVRVWNADTGAVIGLPVSGHANSTSCISFSPFSHRIASGSIDGTVRLWDANTGAPIGQPLSGHKYRVNCLSFSPDGRKIASGSNDCTMRLRDVETGAEIGQPLSGHKYWINCLVFSPDGQKIASGSWDTTVRLWNVETGAAIGEPFVGHTDSIRCLSFSPCGRRIASGSWDRTVRLWSVDKGAQAGQPLSLSFNILSLEFRLVKNDLFLDINNSYICCISDDPKTVLPKVKPISFDDQATIIRAKSNIYFLLPSHFHCADWMIHQGKIVYGGRDGSIIIIDCTQLL